MSCPSICRLVSAHNPFRGLFREEIQNVFTYLDDKVLAVCTGVHRDALLSQFQPLSVQEVEAVKSVLAASRAV